MKTVRDISYSVKHTKDRLWERYGIVIEGPEYLELCRRVAKKINVEFINEEKQKNDLQQIYDVDFKGTSIRVVWSVSKQWIKTVLSK